MIFQVIVLFCPFATATAIDLSEKPGVAIKIYNKPSLVVVDLAQNSYLHFNGIPSIILGGYGVPNITVPPTREKYVWEYTGFLEVETSGIHEFVFTNTATTTLQIGAGRMCYDDVQESITEHIYYMEGSSLEMRLANNTFYPIKIVHLSETRDLSLHFLKPGHTDFEDLHDEVFQVAPETRVMGRRSTRGLRTLTRGCQPTLKMASSGFAMSAYIYDMVDLPQSVTFFYNGYERLRKVIGWSVDDDDGRIKSPQAVAKTIVEFIGTIKYPLHGLYRIEVKASQFVSVQIGRGQDFEHHVYEIDDDWIFADTRDFHSRTFKLSNLYIYPFRIVYLRGDSTEDLELTVTNKQGLEVDLFGLWKSNHSAPLTLGPPLYG